MNTQFQFFIGHIPGFSGRIAANIAMKTLDFHIHTQSTFGKDAAHIRIDKATVAKKVVENVLWPFHRGPANPIFFSDGSSSSYVFSEFFDKWCDMTEKTTFSEDIRIWTSNPDIAFQTMVEEERRSSRITVQLPEGSFDRHRCGIFGESVEKWVASHARRCTCVMSVTSLDARLGPCGKDEDAAAIKSQLIENAKVLVVIADVTKLRNKTALAEAANPDGWQKRLNNKGSLYVVTTRSPHITFPYSPFPPPDGGRDDRTGDELESENLRLLRAKIGGAPYLIVDPPDEGKL